MDEPAADSERFSLLRDVLIPGFYCLAHPPHFHTQDSKGKNLEGASREIHDDFCGICFHHDEAQGVCDFG
jgi:hypothetical protein